MDTTVPRRSRRTIENWLATTRHAAAENDTHVNWPECRMGSPVGMHPFAILIFLPNTTGQWLHPHSQANLSIRPWREGEGEGEREGGEGQRLPHSNLSPPPPLRSFLPHPSPSPERILPETEMNACRLFLLPSSHSSRIFCLKLVRHVTSRSFESGTTPRETRSLLSPVEEPFDVVSFSYGSVRVLTTP